MSIERVPGGGRTTYGAELPGQGSTLSVKARELMYLLFGRL